MEGFRPLHDEQEGRFRTASLHPPAAPNDRHHHYLTDVLPGYGVATMCPPWPIVAFGNVLLPQPLHPAGRGLAKRCADGEQGGRQSRARLAFHARRAGLPGHYGINISHMESGRRWSLLRESERTR